MILTIYKDFTFSTTSTYRYYSPVLGRFLTEDPIGFEAGDNNLYRYVGNSPLIRTDPTGKFARVISILVGGILLGNAAVKCEKLLTPQKKKPEPVETKEQCESEKASIAEACSDANTVNRPPAQVCVNSSIRVCN